MTKSKIACDFIVKCLKDNITSKREIAKRLFNEHRDTFVNGEDARLFVRRVLGSAGRPVSEKYSYVYDLYMAKTGDLVYENAKVRPTVPSKVYFITAAMNATPVHEGMLKNLLSYAAYKKAELYIVAMRYKNPTSVFTDKKDDFWAKETIPYLDANRHDIHKLVSVMSDVKIQPTAEEPLSGLEGMSGDKSCIFAHPRVHMQFVPVLKGSRPKLMVTTGIITTPNYTDSKAGKKGEFHHTYGFVVVEIDSEKNAIIRQVTANSDGSFIDYDIMVKDGEITKAPYAPVLVLGDIHAAKLTSDSLNRIIRTIEFFRPQLVVLHDVFDGESINPHEQNNAVRQHDRNVTNKDDLAKEIKLSLGVVTTIASMVPNVALVRSNHDDFLDRYINSTDWRKDIKNAAKYAELSAISLSGKANKGLFPHLVEQETKNVLCLDIDESLVILGVELGCHGHVGSNGSKGSPNQFRRLSTKLITGHTHSPLRKDGHMVVGCQELDHEYNVGMTSWGLADVIVNADGKRQHVIYFDGKFKL